MQFKELVRPCHSPHLAFWKKASKPLPGPGLEGGTPEDGQGSTGGYRGWCSLCEASEVAETPVRAKAQQGEVAEMRCWPQAGA